jgi:hypothetical protein
VPYQLLGNIKWKIYFLYNLKYCKHKEAKEVSDTIQFLDKHGKEIPACIEYSTDTGYATVYELADMNNPRSNVIIRQKYFS